MKKAIDGEAAYCLTNLEAAICFLETVDLATLKIDDRIVVGEAPKATRENDKPTYAIASLTSIEAAPAADSTTPTPAQAPVASRGRKPARELALAGSTRNRSESSSVPFTPTGDPLSNLSSKLLHAKIDNSLRVAEEAWEQEVAKTPSLRTSQSPDSARRPPPKASLTPASPAAGGTEVVRNRALSYLTKNPVVDVAESVVMGADVGLKTIGDALGGSYKFLFGRMDEKKQEMPKTLEDARKLVEQPTASGVTPKGGNIWGTSLPLPPPSPPPPPPPPPPPQRAGDWERGLQSSSPAAAFAAVGTGLSRVVGMGSGVVMRGFARSSSNVSLDKEKEKVLAEKSFTDRVLTTSASTAPTAAGAAVVGGVEAPSPPSSVSDLLSVNIYPLRFQVG